MKNTSPYEKMGSNDDDTPVLSLTTAMKLADIIRQNVLQYQQKQQQESSQTTTKNVISYVPGMWQGSVAMIGCAVVFVPARQYIIRYSNRIGLGTVFPDLVVTPFLAVAAVQCGLYTGSIYGSTEHLQQLSAIPTTASSPTRDSICQNNYMIELITKLSSQSVPTEESFNIEQNNNTDDDSTAASSTWDPRQQTLDALKNAIDSCRKRNELLK